MDTVPNPRICRCLLVGNLFVSCISAYIACNSLSLFLVRVNGKTRASGAVHIGPIRKITSPAMIAAGAVGPVQHATQVQNAKIKALTGVVKRLQDRRSLEEVASQRTQGLPESSKECDSIERKHTETTYDSPVTHVDFEVSLAGSTHPNQPMPTSGKTFEDESGRELHRKQHFFWRQFAESQLIQERAKQSPITNGVLSDTMHPPVGGSPPKLLFSNSTWKSDNDHQRTRQEAGHALPRTQSGSSGTHESILLQAEQIKF